jgi:hypothetical protein
MKDYRIAMEEGGNMSHPERYLLRALKTCEGGCSRRMLMRIHIGLGTVEGLIKNRMDEAQNQFLTALRLDPSAQLEPDLTTPELIAAFEAARKRLANDAAH